MSQLDSKFVFDYSSSTLKKNLGNFGLKIGAALLMYSATKAVEYESYMKVNRPWVDRTGMAKATLNVKVSRPNENKIRLTFAHGVEYGIWLELAHEKNYAIVAPTINAKGSDFVDGVKNIMSKVTVIK